MEAESTKTKACAVCGQEFDDLPDVCPLDGTRLTVIASQLSPGTVLGGRYEIIAAVADGGMGKVYKARHKLMKRVVAIKTMLPYLISSGTALKRFQQEAESLSQLSHPHVLSVFDFFLSDDGNPYLVMDYLEGTNLAEVLSQEERLDCFRALDIFIMACPGLAHAHEHGIIHRDIKPENIMLVNFDGNADFVKIIDFGIAKLAPSEGGESSHLTATGDVFGSPQYMSPEQCRARPLDARSDVYSLGCVMYRALSGKSAFAGQDQIECMYKHVHDDAPPLSQACSSLMLPAGLEEVLTKAMSREPEARQQSMNELKQELLNIRSAHQAQSATPETKSASTQTLGQQPASPVGTVQLSPESHAPENHSAPVVLQWKEALSSVPLSFWVKCLAALAAVVVVITAVVVSFSHQRAPSRQMIEKSHASEEKGVPGPVVSIVGPGGLSPSSTSPAPGNRDQTYEGGQRQSGSPAPVQTQVGQNPSQLYAQYMSQGQRLFKSGNYSEAQRYFKAAHDVAAVFGESDSRYVDSLEWLGKTAFARGSYEQARQAFEYVLYARTARSGADSAQSVAARNELDQVGRVLKR